MSGWRALAVVIVLLVPPFAAADARPPALERYSVDPQKVTVSGISSGGYMAVQLGVAYSTRFSAVGVIAAGPYGCASTDRGLSGNVNRALGPCMAGRYTWVQKWQCWTFWASCPGADRPDPEAGITLARSSAERRAIDPISQLARQRIFLLSGNKDTTILPKVVDALERFYAAFVPAANMAHERLDQAAHTFPTDRFTRGNACSVAAPPYVSDCKYDGAKQLLSHAYGSLHPRNDGAPKGTLLEFDQTSFVPGGTDPGMADRGYVYVPTTCTGTTAVRCALHVALHGCKQSVADVGKDFVEGAGYNRWADTNAIVVLYPQARKSTDNPQTCWDWWGYTGAAWHEKRAPQMAAIVAMVNRLTASPP